MANKSYVESLRFTESSLEAQEPQLRQAVRRHLPQNFSFHTQQELRFRGRVERYCIGDVQLLDSMATSFAAYRGKSGAAESDDAYISVLRVDQGHKLVQIADREYDLGPGHVLIVESSATSRVKVPDWMMARSQLTIRQTDLRDLGVRWRNPEGLYLSETTASFRFLFNYLDLVRTSLGSAEVTEQAIVAMRNATVELVMGALCDLDYAPSSPSTRTAVLGVAKSYVRGHLSDPALSSARAAAAVHVSVRTLNRSFNDSGESFSEYVWRMRLAGARQDLLNMSKGETISAVAYRWCFADPSHFTRRFRQLYGCLPKELVRQYALQTDPHASTDPGPR